MADYAASSVGVLSLFGSTWVVCILDPDFLDGSFWILKFLFFLFCFWLSSKRDFPSAAAYCGVFCVCKQNWDYSLLKMINYFPKNMGISFLLKK